MVVVGLMVPLAGIADGAVKLHFSVVIGPDVVPNLPHIADQVERANSKGIAVVPR